MHDNKQIQPSVRNEEIESKSHYIDTIRYISVYSNPIQDAQSSKAILKKAQNIRIYILNKRQIYKLRHTLSTWKSTATFGWCD